jgi:hypothetical protein
MKQWFEHSIMRPLHSVGLHPLQKAGLFGLVLLVGVSVSFGGFGQLLNDQVRSILSAVLPGVIVELTNVERAGESLIGLRRNPLLDEAARLKAEHMRAYEYFAHYSPGDNTSPWHWFERVGYNYVHAGENLAIYFDDSAEVVRAWMNSPSHRENILRGHYTEIGVAAVEGRYQGYDTVYVVQLFGTPASPRTVTPTPAVITPTQGSVVALADETPAIQGEAVDSVPVEEPMPEPVPEPSETAVVPMEVAPATEVGSVAVSQEEVADTIPTHIEMVPVEDTVAFMSGHHGTTSPLFAPSVALRGGAPSGSSGIPANALALQVLYALLAVVVTAVLAVSVLLTTHRQVYAQAMYGVALLVIVLLAVYVHVQYVHTPLLV